MAVPLPIEIVNKIFLYMSSPNKEIIEYAVQLGKNMFFYANIHSSYNNLMSLEEKKIYKKWQLLKIPYFNSNLFDNSVIDLDIIIDNNNNTHHKWSDCEKIRKLCIQEMKLYDFWMGRSVIIEEI